MAGSDGARSIAAQVIVLTCAICNAPVQDWSKHRAWHRGVVCDCGHSIRSHPFVWEHRRGSVYPPDPCATCDCPEWKPGLRERVA